MQKQFGGCEQAITIVYKSVTDLICSYFYNFYIMFIDKKVRGYYFWKLTHSY